MGLQTKNFSVTGKSSGGGITYTYILRVTENSTNIQKNTSSITIQAILKQNYSGTAFQNWNTGVSCTLNGKQVFSDYQKRKLEGKTEHIYYTWTGDVAHNDDGTLLLTVGGKLWQSSYASYSPPEMTIAENSANAMTLTVIPRASTIRAADGAVGSCATVVVTRKSAAFTHSIGYRFGDLSGYLDAQGNPVDAEVKLTETTLNFLLPESFYLQIPDAPSGVCTLTCRTYSGNTQIGQDQSGEFTVTAAASLCVPLLEGSVQDIHEGAVEKTGNAKKFIRYVSTARCQIDATPQKGASIKKLTIDGIDVTKAKYLDIDDIAKNKIVLQATDSRGYTATKTLTIDLIPYVLNTNDATVRRTAPTSGKAILTLQGSCWNGDFGATQNVLLYQYTINNGTPSQNKGLTIEKDHTYRAQIELTGLDYTKSHTVKVKIYDRIRSVEKSLTVHKGIPAFDWGENDFAFNVPVSIMSQPVFDWIIEQGTKTMGSNGTWYWSKWASGKAECYGVRNFGDIAITTEWGSIYQSDYFSQALPSGLFSGAPQLIDINLHSTSNTTYGWVSKSGLPSASNTGNFFITRPTSYTLDACHISFHCIGRWK